MCTWFVWSLIACVLFCRWVYYAGGFTCSCGIGVTCGFDLVVVCYLVNSVGVLASLYCIVVCLLALLFGSAVVVHLLLLWISLVFWVLIVFACSGGVVGWFDCGGVVGLVVIWTWWLIVLFMLFDIYLCL